MSSMPQSPLTLAAPEHSLTREILTPAALEFVAMLAAQFSGRRDALLIARKERQARFDGGENPDFLAETAHIREDASWRVAPPPGDLADRRVEITGPTDRKMVINALNSGAYCFMADFEDSNAPTWENMIEGQANLRDAVKGTITYDGPDGKRYELRENPAVLVVRPR